MILNRDLINKAKGYAKETYCSGVEDAHLLMAMLETKIFPEWIEIDKDIYYETMKNFYPKGNKYPSEIGSGYLFYFKDKEGIFCTMSPMANLWNMVEDGDDVYDILEKINFINSDSYKRLEEYISKERDEEAMSEKRFLRSLTNIDYETNPAIGREEIIDKLQRNLMHLNKPNSVLIGEPGVGKTAIVEGLAFLIKNGKCNDFLKDYIIYECNTSALVGGTKYRGEFEEKVNELCDIIKGKKVIIFLDEMHTTINAGGAEGAVSMANILKPYLARGDIRVIGATTEEEFKKYMNDSAYNRRFSIIKVDEPTPSETLQILIKSLPKYEKHYKMTVDTKLMSSVVAESRSIKGLFPDKAFDLLEAALSEVVFTKEKLTKRLIEEVASNLKEDREKIQN